MTKHCHGTILLVLVIVSNAVAEEPQKKSAVPDGTAQAAAQKLIHEVHAADLAKHAPADMAATANSLLREALDTKDDVAARFVMLDTARSLGVRAGDVTIAMKAAGEIDAIYDIDGLALKRDTLADLAKSCATPSANLQLVGWCMALSDSALHSDRYDDASRLLEIAQPAVKKTGKTGLGTDLERAARSVVSTQKEFERTKPFGAVLKEHPDDATANLEFGRFLWFWKGETARALPMLAKAGDPALREAAKLDLTNPTEAAAQTKAADGWWALADATDSERGKTALRARAAFWYQKALPTLKCLSKAKAQVRLAAVAPATSVDEAAPASPTDSRAKPSGVDERFNVNGWCVQCCVNGGWQQYPLDKMTIKGDGGSLHVKNTTGIHNHAHLAYVQRLMNGDFAASIEYKGSIAWIGLKSADGRDCEIYIRSMPNDDKWHTVLLTRRGGALDGMIDGQKAELRGFNADGSLAGFFCIAFLSGAEGEIRNFQIKK